MGRDPIGSTLGRIAFIGNYLPRQCGIATFTTDLCEAVADRYPETSCIALPVNDVAAIVIKGGTNQLDLVRKDNLWRVKQRNDYPANFS